MIDRYTFQYFTCLYLQSNAILHPQLDANLWFGGPSWGSRTPFGGSWGPLGFPIVFVPKILVKSMIFVNFWGRKKPEVRNLRLDFGRKIFYTRKFWKKPSF